MQILPPPDAVPDAPNAPTGTARRPLLIDWEWNCPDQNGQPILDMDLQWRQAGNTWIGNVTTVTASCVTITVPNANSAIEARVRARNSQGTGTSWSPTGSVAAASLLIDVPRRVRLTTSQTYRWPYSGIENAILNAGDPPRAAGSDVDLGTGAWAGGVVDRKTARPSPAPRSTSLPAARVRTPPECV